MKQELIEFETNDGLTLDGLLFTPKTKSTKTVIHVHGQSDNFYQRSFIKPLAQMFTNNGFNFISFNNRGHGNYSYVMKNRRTLYTGSYNELFEESFLDIEAAINYCYTFNTDEIILSGHSMGASKIMNYYFERQANNIKSLILLAPCDAIKKHQQLMQELYDDFIIKAKELVKEDNGNKELYSPVLFPRTYTAKSFLNNFLENTPCDIYRYRDSEYIDKRMQDIKIPILIEIGTNDQMAFISEEDDITPFFKRNLTTTYKIEFIEGSKHSFYNFEKELVKNIELFIKENK